MAIAGDIIIKLVADFAEFAQGMTSSAKSLEQFGKKAEGIAGQIEGVFKVIKGAAVVTALTYAVKAVIDELDRLETKFTDIAEKAETLGVGTARFEELRIAALASGVGVDALAATMAKLKGITDGAIQGNAGVIDSLNKLGVTVLDYTGKQRSQEEINKRIAIAFGNMPASIEKLRLQYTLLGESGESTDKKLRLLAESSEDAGAKLAAFRVEEAVARIKTVEDRLKAAQERFDLLKAAAVLPLKADALEGWAASLERLNAAIVANDLTKLGNILKTLFSTKALLELGYQSLDPNSKPIEAKLKSLEDEATALQAKLDKGPQGKGGVLDHIFGTGDGDYQQTRNRLYDVYAEIGRIKSTLTKDFPSEGVFQVPTTEKPGKQPSKVATAGAGGGRSDLETIDTLIERYDKMTAAAKAASAALLADTTTNIKDLGLVIEARQAAAEAVAKIEQRLKAKLSDEDIARLTKSIELAKVAQAEQARDLQYTAAADALDKRLSGTTKGLSSAVDELNRAWRTGRLSIVAYTRALAEIQEQQEHVRLQSTRFDNNLESLKAGFDDAALSFARANDLFSVGGQAFNGLTGAMGEGLDVLAGKSDKTFQQIAADFALMLAKLAVQAAASRIFSALFGDPLASAGLSGSPYYGPPASFGPTPALTRRAGGGAVYPGQQYWVGEYGPERFVPSAAGQIMPTASTASAGDVTVNVAMGGRQKPPDAKSSLEFARRVKAAVLDTIQNEQRPGGILYARG